MDDIDRRRRAVLLRQRIRRHGIPSQPLRKLLQQVELLRSRAHLLRPDLRRSSELLRSGAELLRSGRELLQQFGLLPPPVELLQEPVPPDEVLQEPVPQELLCSGPELLRSGPDLLRSDVRRSDVCRSDLRRSLQLVDQVTYGLWSRSRP
ncbi:MAG: hypothetical protein ACM3U2_19835 [Deltaproteobacteria bacterium]